MNIIEEVKNNIEIFGNLSYSQTEITMAQSYIPAGTDVICTKMLSTLPSQIVTEREAKVLVW